MDEAKKINTFMAIAVVSPSGDLVYFEKMDNTQYASVNIAIHKARTAARFRRPTSSFEERVGQGGVGVTLLTLDDIIASPGGNPIIVYGIGLLVLIAAFVTFRHEWITPRSRWLRDLFVALVVCCFLTLVGYQFFRLLPLRWLTQ